MKAYNDTPVFFTLKRLFFCYLESKDIISALSAATEDICCVWNKKIICSKGELKSILEENLYMLPEQLSCRIAGYQERECSGQWMCICRLELYPGLAEEVMVAYFLDISATVIEEDGYKVSSVQISDMNYKIEPEIHMESFWNNVPGGIIVGYSKDNYPLYFVNNSFLEMTGYSEEEFFRLMNGNMFGRILPGDREHITDDIERQLKLYDRYVVEYGVLRKDGTFIWVYDIGYKRTFNGKDEMIISLVVDISRKMKEQEKLREDSFRDELTGLLNRKGGRIRIIQGLERRSPYIFMMLDIDYFKEVNDYYGHMEGDNVLRILSRKIKESFREDDSVIRLGGDEFVVFLCPCKDKEKIEKKCELLCQNYSRHIREKYPRCRGSITMAGIWSEKYFPISQLYEITDEILYDMKRNKKGQCRIDTV